MAGDKASRFDTLDLLRGIAALAVVSFHVFRPAGSAAPLPRAYLAVDLFFCLSGFVLAHAYAQRFLEGETVGRFMLRRLIRLYPFYLVGTLLGAALLLNDIAAGTKSVASITQCILGLGANLLFLPAAVVSGDETNSLFPVLFPAWSLFWELIANFLFALVAARMSWRSLSAILLAGLLMLFISGGSYDTLDAGARWIDMWAGGGRVIWSFFAGVALQRFYAQARPAPLTSKWLQPALAAVLLVVMAQTVLGWAVDLVTIVLLFPLLVFIGARTSNPTPFGHWLGYVSYGVYVLHAPLIDLIDRVTKWLIGVPLEAMPVAMRVLPCIGISLAAAAVASRHFDDPTRAWLSRLHVRRMTLGQGLQA